MTTRFQTRAAVALVLGVSLAVSGCGKYSIGRLKARKSYKEAIALYSGQDWRGAVAKYEDSLRNDPDNTEAFFYLGNSYDNLYKPARAGEAENDANIQKAIMYYQKSAEHGPNPAIKKLALQYLVAAYGPEKLNDPTKAEPLVQQMIKLEPTDPTNYFALMKIYEDAGRYEDAEAAINKARDAKPNDPLVWTSMAGFYNRQGSFDKTMEALHKAADLAPKDPQGYHLIATYYQEKVSKDHRLSTAEKKEYIKEGLKADDKALELNPEYIEAMVYKNILLRLQGNEETDMGKRAALYKQADDLRNKAIEMRRKKVTGVS